MGPFAGGALRARSQKPSRRKKRSEAALPSKGGRKKKAHRTLRPESTQMEKQEGPSRWFSARGAHELTPTRKSRNRKILREMKYLAEESDRGV